MLNIGRRPIGKWSSPCTYSILCQCHTCNPRTTDWGGQWHFWNTTHLNSTSLHCVFLLKFVKFQLWEKSSVNTPCLLSICPSNLSGNILESLLKAHEVDRKQLPCWIKESSFCNVICQISRPYSRKILCFCAFLAKRMEGKTRNLACWYVLITSTVDFGYVQLLIFLILAQFSLKEMGQIWHFLAFSIRCVGEMAWNLARWCTLITVRTVWILIKACWCSQHWCNFHLLKQFSKVTWRSSRY